MYDSFSVWLASVVSLFDKIISAATTIPIFSLILAVLLFIVLFTMFAWLTARGRIDRR